MLNLILLSLAGTVISVITGTIWYSNSTPMGKLHMKYLGFDKLSEDEKRRKIEEGKQMMAKMYSAQMLLSLISSFAVVFMVITSLKNGLNLPMAMGFVAFNWLCFTVPSIGTGILWSNTDHKLASAKFASDSLYQLVTLLLIALLASFFA